MSSHDFKVWYDNGATYTGPPEQAPKRGVICIAQKDPDCGRTICRSDDFYIYSIFDGRPGWQGVDQFGLHDYLIEPGYKLVLFGRTIGNNEYKEILRKAIYDPDLPVKSPWDSGERRG